MDVSLTSQMLAALQRAISIGVADLEREKEKTGLREKNVSLDVAERALLVATNLCSEHSSRARFASSAEFLSALLDLLEVQRVALSSSEPVSFIQSIIHYTVLVHPSRN